MFRSTLNRILDWAEGALAAIEDEFLTVDDDLVAADYDSAAAQLGRHPHRRELRWERERRPGSLPHPPAHCISPVARRDGEARTREERAR